VGLLLLSMAQSMRFAGDEFSFEMLEQSYPLALDSDVMSIVAQALTAR
jgi:hypothetical protein